MSNNDFLEKINEDNHDFEGRMKSLTLIVIRGDKQKKIFKILFEKGKIDFYITFPYFKSDTYYCGSIDIPEYPTSSGSFNAVENGAPSLEPVKFSYHADGNIHFKRTNLPSGEPEPWKKLAQLKAKPITELEGGHLFTIQFEGLDRFADVTKHARGNGDEEAKLHVPEDILTFQILAYAATSEDRLTGLVKEGAQPWFVLGANSKEGRVYIGFYAILSRDSYVQDENKNGLVVRVGFDKTNTQKTGLVRSLYLYAR